MEAAFSQKKTRFIRMGLLVITFLASLSSFMLVAELTVIQVRIEAALRQRSSWVPCSIIALVHDQNQVRIPDRGQSMRDDKAGAVLHQLIHRFLDIELRSGIHALVASSRIRIDGLARMARAIVRSASALRYVRGLLVQNGIVAVRRVRMK